MVAGIARAAAVLTLGLTGCAMPTWVQVYEGPARDKSEIVVLKTTEIPGESQGIDLLTTIGAPESKPEPRRVGDTFRAYYPPEVRVLPGLIEVRLHCYRHLYLNVGEKGMPTIRLDAKAGFTYELTCQRLQKGLVRASLVRSYPTTELAAPGSRIW